MARRHVIILHRQFVPPVIAGTKLHTLRHARRRAVNIGDILDLRAWEGVPYRSKMERVLERECVGNVQIEVDATCREIYLKENGSWHYPKGPRHISDIHEQIALAKRDGFPSAHAFFTWFASTYGRLFVGHLLEWKP